MRVHRAEPTKEAQVSDPNPNEFAAPVDGEAITLDAVIPSEDAQAKERSNRVGRTSIQVGTPAAIVTIGTWIARRQGLDLDPGAGVDLPAEVASAFVAVVGTMLAYWMNRP